MKKYINRATENLERADGRCEKYICKDCKSAYFSVDYGLCTKCESLNSGDKEDTLYIFADCFSHANGKPDQFAGYCTIVTNTRFDLEDKYNMEYLERRAFEGATNNYGELMGVVAGLDYFINEEDYRAYKTIKVISDSQYVILGARERMYKWKSNGWTNTSGEVKNKEVWQLMYDICGMIKKCGIDLQFIHQKGHVGKAVSKEDNPIIYLQEKCDTFAVALKESIKKSRSNK